MGDQLEARISAIECIQEEFGYDIREIKEQLARLTKLIEDRAEARVVQPREFSPSVPRFSPHCFPNPNSRPYIPAMNKVSNKTYRPNLCTSMHVPVITSAGVRMSRFVNQSSSSRDQPKRQKVSKDRTRLDPIPLSYTELFPKLLEKGLIKPVHLPPLRPPFPKWYEADVHCDYHAGNPGHSLENCTALKYKVQELIQEGKVKFEKLDEQDEVRHSLPIFSRTKEDMTKGKQDDKFKEKGVGCSSTTPKPEKRPYETVWGKVKPMEGKEEGSHEERKTLQNLVQNLEQMFNEQKEYVTALREEHDRQIMKRIWTPEAGDA